MSRQTDMERKDRTDPSYVGVRNRAQPKRKGWPKGMTRDRPGLCPICREPWGSIEHRACRAKVYA